MREQRIDIIRGLAMLTIAINHFSAIESYSGYNGPKLPTATKLGFSSAAEIFVFMSGYMIGMVYLNKGGLLEKCASRAKKLYIYNSFAFLTLVILSPILTQDVIIATDLKYSIANPGIAIIEFLAFLQHPFTLNVLQLYTVLLVITPIFSPLLLGKKQAFIIISFLVYSFVQIFPEINLPGGQPSRSSGWDFNIFAWQFIYFLGMVSGMRRFHKPVFEWLESNVWRACAPVLLFGIIAVFSVLERLDMIAVPLWEKQNLEPLRLLHFWVHLGLFCSASLFVTSFLPSRVQSALAKIGKNTLQCFTASMLGTYFLASLSGYLGHTSVTYAVCLMLLLVSVYAVAEATNIIHARRAAASTR